MLALATAALAANRTVAVVIAPSFYLIDAMGPLDVFRAVQLKAYAGVNLTSHEWHGDVPGGIVANGSLRVDLLAESAAPVRASDGTVVTPDGTLAAAPHYDLVVVPAGADTPAIAQFVRAHYARGGALLSVCVGSELLARLGLLDGREATSKSLLLWRLRRDYPAVNWVSLRDRVDRRFVVSDPPLRIVTAAGVTAGVDGALTTCRLGSGRRSPKRCASTSSGRSRSRAELERSSLASLDHLRRSLLQPLLHRRVVRARLRRVPREHGQRH